MSFALTNEMSHTVKDSIEYTFSNTEDNNLGEYGFKLLSKPALKNRNYQRLAFDGRTELGRFTVTWVDKIDLLLEPYKLAEPDSGMRKRPASTDLEAWKDPNFGDYGDAIRIRPTHQLVLDRHGVEAEVALSLTDIETSETGGSAQLRISGEGTIKKLFNIGGSASYSFSMSTKTQSEVSKHIMAKAHLPAPPQNHTGPVISQLIVEPTWLIPARGAEIDPKNPPYWIPAAFNQKMNIPWCISWKVIKVIR